MATTSGFGKNDLRFYAVGDWSAGLGRREGGAAPESVMTGSSRPLRWLLRVAITVTVYLTPNAASSSLIAPLAGARLGIAGEKNALNWGLSKLSP
jgi:hypothetical protein